MSLPERAQLNLNLERILRFVVVAEQLSFTRAAAILGMDQPWLSRQVIQLEEQLGFLLFDRTRARIELTPDGQEFFQTALEIVGPARRLREKAAELNRRNQDALRIGVAYSTFQLQARSQLLERYAEIRPKVRLELSSCEYSDEVVDKLRAGELDFGIVVGPITASEVDACELDVIDYALAVPAEDPLAQQPDVELAALRGRRIAVAVKDIDSPRYRFAYSWIAEVGATAVRALDGRRFIFDVAQKERLFVVCYASADDAPEGFVMRPIRGPHPRPHLMLGRNKRTLSSAGERLWRLGQEIAEARLSPA
jgi:DNA-binding transcriptional LysR family regulator